MTNAKKKKLQNYWNKFVKRLRANFPTDKPVRVVFDPELKELGLCEEFETFYRITLRLHRIHFVMKDVLMHEWAHILAGWTDYGSTHTNAWGICYARIMRVMQDKVGDVTMSKKKGGKKGCK